ncbi:FAD-binding oxidoreductase [Methylobacillus sp.]|uniref:FAD-binding oxidoreductase n=1 Tax=Methylobacillus sp. TaxID=56818 RepID=UPI002FE379B8
MTLSRQGARAPKFSPAVVERMIPLNETTLEIRLRSAHDYQYQAGQYLPVCINDQMMRYYSLASAPSVDMAYHLHVKKGEEGSSGWWVHHNLKPGHKVFVGQPAGASTYQPQPDTPMLLVATGSGLASFYGIVREALFHGHEAPIRLYHGVRHGKELYLMEQLRALEKLYPNLHYIPCISGSGMIPHCQQGRALDIAMASTSLSADWKVYFSGHPDMVHDGWKAAMARGMSTDAIFSDHQPDLGSLMPMAAAKISVRVEHHLQLASA